MIAVLFLALLVVPILELWVFFEVADRLGFGSTLLWLLAVSAVGAWLVKREGLSAWRRANARIARGEVPTDELANGILILFGGALMLTPGFLTDVVGLTLVFPPTRAAYRVWLRARFAVGPVIVGRFRPGTGEVWDVAAWDDEPPPPAPRQELG